jgi:hypothetical protein
MIALGGMTLAVLAGAGGSFGQDRAAEDPGKAAEGRLAEKDLRKSGVMYVLFDEDSVKKAADTVEARLKEYRQVVAREKGAVQAELDKRTMIAELTKQREALKQQRDQEMPNIQAQLQTLNQQQAALRLQINSMQGGGNRYAQMQRSQLQSQSNQLGAQINMLQARGQQFAATLQGLNDQIQQLSARPDANSKKAEDAAKPAIRRPEVSADDRRESYVRALGQLRKQVDEVTQKYAALAEDADVTAALATLNERSTKIKYELGPSRKFLDTVKALDQAEARVASETILDDPKPAGSSSAKKKAKTARSK